MSSSTDVHYVCQRAANAIITEIGPYRVSTDALQNINQFLDNFILLLLSPSCLNLASIKSVVTDVLLPFTTLGKNAIIEAEIETKSFGKVETIDYSIGLPLSSSSLLRSKCLEFCTLADKRNNTIQEDNTVISPLIVIYVTTIIEHVAEYILNAIAKVAEQERVNYIKVKQVFLALQNDPQLASVFNRMDLKDKLQKRVSGTISIASIEKTGLSFPNFQLDDGAQLTKHPSTSTTISETYTKNRKSIYSVFKENSELPLTNFEELFKSGETVKVSLTPKRLTSIEVKNDATARYTTSSLPIKHTTAANSKKERFTRKAFSLSLPLMKLSNRFKDTHKTSSINLTQESIVQRPPSKEVRRSTDTSPSLHNLHDTPKNIPTLLECPLAAPTTPSQLNVASLNTAMNNRSISPSTVDIVSQNSLNASPPKSTSISSTSPISSTITTLSSVSPAPITPIDNTFKPFKQERSSPTAYKPSSTVILRRSSVSSKKSRENLRRLKEQNESVPTSSTDKPEQLDTNEPSPDHNTTKDDETVSKGSNSHTLERPSSVVAKRVSMLNDSRRRSYHEQCATEKYSSQPVSAAIKQWDQLVSPPTPRRSSAFNNKTTNAVLDKVLKFEHIGKYYMQQGVTEKKKVPKAVLEGIDRGVQTDFVSSLDDDLSEHGQIEGDEEWFLNDYDWEEHDEIPIVEWLLGE